jgi:hypothetical protein
MERKCAPNNKPPVLEVLKVIKEHCGYSEAKSWTEERLTQLINGMDKAA